MKNKYTKELLEPIIKISISWADVCRKLNIKPMTGSQTHMKKIAVCFGIDHSHFLGQAHNRGKSFKKKNVLEYCFNGSTINSHRLREILIRDGYKQKHCEICMGEKWFENDIPLELDHIDNNHYNNELDNLQIICPNCHAIKTKHKYDVKILHPKNENKTKYFCECGKEIRKKSKTCVNCYNINERKVNRPSNEQLLIDVNEIGYCATGKKYGVSDNAIRKWLKFMRK